jgi:PAS domain S-box-containing protein
LNPKSKKNLKKRRKAHVKGHDIRRETLEHKRIKKEPAESEQTYRDLADHAATGMATADLKGRFTYANQVMADFIGHPARDLIGRPFKDYIHPEDRGRVTSLFLKALLLRRPLREVELRAMGPEGSVRHLLMRPSPMRAGGKTVGFSAVMIDVTERKQMEEALKSSEERLRILFEYAPDAYYLNDLKGTLIDGNKAAEKTTGFKKEELIGKSFLSLKLLPPEQIPKAAALLLKNALGQPTGPDEFTLNRKDGNQVTVEIRTYPVKIRDKFLVLGIARDVTERKRIEQEIQRSSRFLEEMASSLPDLVFIKDKDLKYVLASDAACDFVGKPRHEILGRTAHDIYLRGFADNVEKTDKDVFERGAVVEVPELLSKTRDGRAQVLHTRKAPLKDSQGTVTHVIAITRDITERKQMEEALRESEANLKDAQAIGRIGSWEFDVESREITWSDQTYKLYDRDPALGPPTAEEEATYYPPEQALRLREYARQAIEEEKDFKYDLETKLPSGRPAFYSATMHPIKDSHGRVVKLFGTVQDITERKRTEDELRRSEERFRKIFQSSPIPATITLLKGPIVDVNEAWVRMSGYSREEAIGHSTIELGMVPDPEQRDQILKDLLKKRRLSNVEITRRTKSGELRDLLNTLELVELDGQECILNLQVDITERKGMEKELRRHSENLEKLVEERTRNLRESEEKFRRIYNASLDAIYTTSLGGEIVDMNPAGVSMLGFDSLDELKKVNIESLYVNLEDQKRLIELASKGLVRDFEVQFRRKDGERIDAIINCHPLKDEQGRITALQGAIIDITERRHMERLRDEFVADVTDELLTPLVSMKGYIDYILKKKQMPLPEDTVSSLQAVKRNTDRLLDLTNALVDIRRMEARKLKLNLEPLNLREIVEQCVRETQPLTAKKQTLHVELPEGPLPIRGHPARLSQVLMNLLSNAVKFTPEGKIILRVKAMENAIEVQVSDTGIGIKKEDLQRIFEPFAAIQKPSYVKGTGLGLSITKGLVEAHGGKIWAESPGEGKGATFTFTLPRGKEND